MPIPKVRSINGGSIFPYCLVDFDRVANCATNDREQFGSLNTLPGTEIAFHSVPSHKTGQYKQYFTHLSSFLAS